MHKYLIDTEFASKSLIESTFKEEAAFNELSFRFKHLKLEFEHLVHDFVAEEDLEDLDDERVQFKFQKLGRFRGQHNFAAKEQELANLELSIYNKRFSFDSLATGLLQIAKQGISIVHAGLPPCPFGRFIGTETLKNIIWQGRNQAMHCEEGNPSGYVKSCFQNLTSDFGSDFDITIDYKINKAKAVIGKLAWNTYDTYLQDMILLLG